MYPFRPIKVLFTNTMTTDVLTLKNHAKTLKATALSSDIGDRLPFATGVGIESRTARDNATVASASQL